MNTFLLDGNQEEPEKKEETEKEAKNDDLENEDTEPDIDTMLETILDKAKNTAEDIPDHHSDEKESVDIFLMAGRETKPETTNHET